MIVIWEWEEVDDRDIDVVTHVSETSFNSHYSTDPDTGSYSDATQCSPVVQSTVTFKCIGCQHSASSQKALETVSELLDKGESVPVDIFAEKDNPHDSKAIAFKCWLNNEWIRIGYVVKEARDAVHKAKEDGLIGQISFKWAKFMSNLGKYSSPAFYAGINITKYGTWEAAVHRCASIR